MKRKPLVSLVALVAASIALAQGGAWKTIASSDKSITLSVPSGWTAMEDSEEFRKQKSEFLKANPTLGAAVSGSGDKNQILRAFDFDDDANDGFVDNVNIVKKPAGGLTPALYDQVGEAVGQQLPFRKGYAYATVTIPAGKAMRYSGVLDLKTPGGDPFVMELIGYMLVKNDNLYVITLGTSEGKLKNRAAIFDKIAKSAVIK